MIKIINNILHLALALLLAFVVGRAFVSILLIWGVDITIIVETQFALSNIFVGFILFMIMYWSIDKIKTKRR